MFLVAPMFPLLPYSAAHETAVVEGVCGGGRRWREVQRSAQPKCRGHRLVDPLNAAGHEIIEEDETIEKGQARDDGLRLLLLILLLGLVEAGHGEGEAGQHQEAQAEQDAPGTSQCVMLHKIPTKVII
jgi:hypothetical protein